MFHWFKWFKKENESKSKKQESAPATTPPPTIEEIDRAQRERSNQLYQARQREQQGFDPYHLDLSKLDTSPLTSVEKQYLKKIVGQPVKNPSVAGYWQYEYGLDFVHTMTKLLGNGYLTFSTGAENLSYATVPQLKAILKQYHLPVSGKKAELIQRICEHLSEDELASCLSVDLTRYLPTEKGRDIVASTPDSITKDVDLEDACLDAIRKRDFQEACKLINRSGMKQDVSLSQRQCNMYALFLDDASDVPLIYRESLILGNLLGVPNPAPLIRRLCKTFDPELLQYTWHILLQCNSLLQIDDYRSMGITHYQIISADDENVCPICRKKDGKIYPLSEAQVGVNFPPFCADCRCTTAAYFED